MFEQFEFIRGVLNQSKSTLAAYIDISDINAFETEFQKRTQDAKPIVMVYGVYNAGKSTLLNALLGQELAEMGDIPKTAVVSSYQVGDVEILDTPGIDAPIEHEEISREQLEKSDAMIFVLSSDGVLEEQQTYIEISKILKAGKPLVIVINNKSNHKEGDEDYLILTDRFRNNLYTYFSNDNQLLDKLDKTETFLVNAKMALKGKIENKQKLIEFSKISQLEKAVSRLFEKTTSAQIAHTLAFQLSELLERGIQSVNSQAGELEMKKLADWLNKVNQAQNDLETRVKVKAENEKPSLRINIRELMRTGNNEQIESAVASWSENLSGYFQHQLERTIKQLDIEAQQVVDIFFQSSKYAPCFASNDMQNVETSGISNLLGGLIKEVGKHRLSDNVLKDGIVYSLKQGKVFVPNLFKGIGPKTMEKMAGRVVPCIGPAIDIIIATRSYYKAKKQEDLEIIMERQRLENINVHSDQFINDIYDNFYEAITDTLDDTFKPIISPIETALETLSIQHGGVESDIRALERWKNRLTL